MVYNSNPLVSIITICRNSERTIRRCIESVLSQSYTNIEYIIQDGASTDRTLDIIKGIGMTASNWYPSQIEEELLRHISRVFAGVQETLLDYVGPTKNISRTPFCGV